MNYWPFIKHLFDSYDGGFPDIWMNGLSEEEILSTFHTLVSFCGSSHNKKVWSFERGTSLMINEIIHHEREFGEGRFESFSHKLTGLKVNGIELFDVDLWVEDDVLALDYKPGDDWNEYRVIGLFKLLYQLQQQTPSVHFSHADEGCRGTPHLEFTKAFTIFCSEMNS